MITIRPLKKDEWENAASLQLRESDLIEDELMNPSGKTRMDALDFSDYLWGVYKETKLIGIIGIKNKLLWGYGTEDINRNSIGVMKAVKPFLKKLVANGAIYYNWFDPSNRKIEKWLQLVGCEVPGDTHDVLNNGVEMKFFYLTKESSNNV